MTVPRRLLSINNYHYPRGGADVVFLEHNRLFEKSGWNVTPFAMQHANNLPSTSDEHFVEEIEFGQSYSLAGQMARAARVVYSREAQSKIAALINKTPPQIAHAHNIYHHISPSIFPVLRKAGIPVVMTVHDLKLACPAYTMRVDGAICERCRGGRIHNVLLNRCIKGSAMLSGLVMVETAVHRLLGVYESNVSRFVVPSRFVIDKLVEWGWSRDRFVHIPNFIQTERFMVGKAPGSGFLYFGRLSAEKGVDTLIRAGALSGQPVIIVGEGAERENLERLAAQLDADVRFLGYLTGAPLHDAIRAARAVVLPSTWYENAPMSVLESLALGRPVIGSAIGGIAELIGDENGATVPPGDAEALAAVLDEFATFSDERIAKMGADGRAMVEQSFNAALYRDRMLDLYSSLQGTA